MQFLIDSAILIDQLRGFTPAHDWLNRLQRDEAAISMVSSAELITGCRNKLEQTAVEKSLATYQMLWIDEPTSQIALSLYRQFFLSHNNGFFDCLIAATALRHQIVLATINDKHFRQIPNLQLLRPY